MDPLLPSNDVHETDHAAREKIQYRHEALATGLAALPNLFVRSAFTLAFLYGILSLVLITIVQLGYMTPDLALLIGVGFAIVQFALGPWIMDLSLRWLYSSRWVEPTELPSQLQSFVAGVCERHRMKFPHFCVIDDGAPQAFTYGHHPSNARVVISRGLMEMLTPDELDGVVAHELGHARNWDMALMTLANLVPLLLYYLYRTAIRLTDGDGKNKAKDYAWIVAVGAYVLYIVAQYAVLWFSRTREYYADRFAGQETNNPNALARALVKIAYGLASQGSEAAPEGETEEAKKAREEKRQKQLAGVGALGALNIFDRNSAVTLVMGTAGTGVSSSGPDLERTKSAMQWDLWNPWAMWFELHSTHPLTAKRLEALGDQAAFLGQKPLLMFDRKKPESYWDEFFVDVFIMMLPFVGMLLGLGIYVAVGVATGNWVLPLLFLAVTGLGLGMLARTLFAYRGQIFEHLNVAALLGHVKVSPVRPVPATVTGKIIGKGDPGLIYSEDFVLRDETGILFMDYQQPLAIWNFFFGLLKAGTYQGKEVRATGWFRRAPVPYLEVLKMEVVDGSAPSRTCYSYHAALIFSGLLAIGGIVGLCLTYGKVL